MERTASEEEGPLSTNKAKDLLNRGLLKGGLLERVFSDPKLMSN